MDDFARNNWIIVIIIGASIILISTNIFMFNGMLTSVANHIDHVVEQTANNMTLLTKVLIQEQKEETNTTKTVVDEQTTAFVKAVGNFTDVIIRYSAQNDQNLKGIYNLLNGTVVPLINVTTTSSPAR